MPYKFGRGVLGGRDYQILWVLLTLIAAAIGAGLALYGALSTYESLQ